MTKIHWKEFAASRSTSACMQVEEDFPPCFSHLYTMYLQAGKQLRILTQLEPHWMPSDLGAKDNASPKGVWSQAPPPVLSCLEGTQHVIINGEKSLHLAASLKVVPRLLPKTEWTEQVHNLLSNVLLRLHLAHCGHTSHQRRTGIRVLGLVQSCQLWALQISCKLKKSP